MDYLVNKWRNDAQMISSWGMSDAAKVLHRCADELEAALVTVGPASDEWVTPTEAATALRINRTTIYALLRQKDIPRVRVGRTIRIRRDALERAINPAA